MQCGVDSFFFHGQAWITGDLWPSWRSTKQLKLGLIFFWYLLYSRVTCLFHDEQEWRDLSHWAHIQ